MQALEARIAADLRWLDRVLGDRRIIQQDNGPVVSFFDEGGNRIFNLQREITS